MRTWQVARAAALGLFLAATPFLRYAHLGAELLPHADHAPRHGGTLQMIGDHHLELVRRGGRIEVFTSDARRRPERPVHGQARFDDGPPIPLRWQDHRLHAADARDARVVRVEVELDGGERVAWTFRAP